MSSFGDAAASVISTVAPLLGTALGGPLGGLAGGLLAKALGKKDPTTGAITPATTKEIENALLGGDPATMLAVKQCEADLQKHMADLGIQEEQLAYQDVDSARKREETVRDRTPSILAYTLTAGVILLIFCLFKLEIPPENKAVMFSVAGAVVSTWGMAMGYFFGSSMASAQKTNGLIQAIQSKK